MSLFRSGLRALTEAINRSRGCLDLDLDGTIRNANANFLNLVGYSRAELVGKSHSLLLPPRSGTARKALCSGPRCGRASRLPREFKRITKAGDESGCWPPTIPCSVAPQTRAYRRLCLRHHRAEGP